VLYIDATYVPLKRDSVDKEAVYVVLGLRDDGRRELLGYYLPGGNERASNWKEIFDDLIKRGLREPRLIISDDLTGLDDVLKEVFQNSFLKGKVDNYTQFLRFPDKRRRVQISFSICSLARSVRDSYQGGSDILVLYKRCLGSERRWCK